MSGFNIDNRDLARLKCVKHCIKEINQKRDDIQVKRWFSDDAEWCSAKWESVDYYVPRVMSFFKKHKLLDDAMNVVLHVVQMTPNEPTTLVK